MARVHSGWHVDIQNIPIIDDIEIECIIGQPYQVVKGTLDEPITGLDDGSTQVVCDAFADRSLRIVWTTYELPSIEQEDESNWYSRPAISDNYFNLDNALTEGEWVKIVIYVSNPISDGGGGTDTNFAEDDLTFTDNRIHDLNGNTLTFMSGADTRLHLSSDGYLGIGTEPDAMLHINSSIASAIRVTDDLDNAYRFTVDSLSGVTISDPNDNTSSMVISMYRELTTTSHESPEDECELFICGIDNQRLPLENNTIYNGTVAISRVNVTDSGNAGINNTWVAQALYYLTYKVNDGGTLEEYTAQHMQGQDEFIFVDDAGILKIFAGQVENPLLLRATATIILNKTSMGV